MTSTLALLFLISGDWQGNGTLFNQGMLEPAPVEMSISIRQTKTLLSIRDCWKNANLRIDECYQSDYTINENDQIIKDGKKIGDVFPGNIVIFESNDQASEQMVFEFNDFEDLRFRYSFTTYDGQTQLRRGGLKKQKAPLERPHYN